MVLRIEPRGLCTELHAQALFCVYILRQALSKSHSLVSHIDPLVLSLLGLKACTTTVAYMYRLWWLN